ncbi:OmpA family protein [Flavobacterium weaverense]|uniref:OmpA family protein n=1 Tax=Flavobacterium weaverense TaxID=271156 RepID=UPI000EF9846A|nr:OmpA family protein [Flavobacterium weaverense]
MKVNDVTIPKSEIERIGNKELIEKHYGYSFDFNMLDDIKRYIIKTKDREVWVQYYVMNDESGRITILEKANLKTLAVTKINANQMKTDLDLNGKSILNINFDTDKASLKSDGKTIVEEIILLLKSNQKLKLSIEGQTGNSGIATKNKQLSLDRANTVLNELVKNGIDKIRLKAIGYGAKKPLVNNESEANKAINRRVELVKF